MGTASTTLSFPELLAELRRLCANESTGFALIRPSGARLARISLQHGEIVFLSFQETSGMAALPLLASIDSCQLDFVAGLGGTSKIPLPPTGQILDTLAAAGTGTTGPSPSRTAAHGAHPQPICARTRFILEAALAERIGPMAAILCQEDFAEAHDLDSAIQALAREIPDAEDARTFVAEVRAELARDKRAH